MGLTFVVIEDGNPNNPDVTVAVKFLIDSGAIYSAVSSLININFGKLCQ